MGQGFFESDDDYQARMSREANERAVERSTGEAPRQGWFESDEQYGSRISLEANERTISDLSGQKAHQGWFESNSDYRSRMDHESNEATVNAYSDNQASQGWFESDEDYRHRTRHEANKAYVARYSDDVPDQGWLESDADYRRRISLNAREASAARTGGANSSSDQYEHSGGFSDTTSNNSSDGLVFLALGLVAVCVIVYFIVTVVVPIVAINLSFVLLILSISLFKKRSGILLPLSVFALSITIIDYNFGVLTQNLSRDFPVVKDCLFPILALNWLSACLSGFLTLMPLAKRDWPMAPQLCQSRQRVLALASAIFICGAVSVSTQLYFWGNIYGLAPNRLGNPSLDAATATSLEQAPAHLAPAFDTQSSRSGSSQAASPPLPSVEEARESDVPQPPSEDAAIAPPSTSMQSHLSQARKEAERPVGPSVQCIMPDGRERRLDMQSCEDAGGMEYR